MNTDDLTGLEKYRAEKYANTHDALITGATKLFVEDGFHGASMKELARIADISTATLYKHIDGKDELFCACLTAQLEEREDGTINLEPALQFLERVARSSLAKVEVEDGSLAAELMEEFFDKHS